MARTKKKLQESDINRNASPQISHTIKKISENERKYTAILVIAFMILFIFIGYHFLSIPKEYSIEQMEEETSLSAGSNLVVLTKEYQMSDEDGLKTKPHYVELNNNSDFELNYRIVLEQDERLTSICGCSDRTMETKSIRFSLDKTQVNTLDDTKVISEGKIARKTTELVPIQLWQEEIESDIDYHFHGHFIVEIIN